MPTKFSLKTIFTFIFLFFMLISIPLAIFLVRERQEIRKKAAVPGGAATVSLSPATGTYNPGETFTASVNFNTANIPISSIGVRITYPFSGATSELEASNIKINPNLLTTGDWSCPVKMIYSEDNRVKIDIACINLSINGFSSLTDTLLATFNLVAHQIPAINPTVLEFDPNESVIQEKSDNQDILLIPTSTSTYTIGTEVTPTPTVISTPTPTPGGEYPGCDGLDAPDNVGQGEIVTLTAHPAAPAGTALESVEFWYIPEGKPLCPGSSWVHIGNDFDGSNGWSVSWNTTGVPCGRYFIAANVYLEGHEWWCTGNPDGPCNQPPKGTACPDCSTWIDLVCLTPTPTPTVISTPTPTPGGEYPGCDGLDAPDNVGQGEIVTLTAHPAAPAGTSLESVEFWYIKDGEDLCSGSSWVHVGNDSDGSNGWSVSWNTTGVPCGRYFIAANVYLEGHEWWCTGNPVGPCNQDPRGTVCPACSTYIEVTCPTPTPNCSLFAKGDANCDNSVDELDYDIWWDSYLEDLDADFNSDGKTNELDYVIWWSNYWGY